MAMTKLRALLAGVVIATLAVTALVAQSVVQDNLSGNETWQAGQGPGGPGSFITSAMVRGGTNGGLVTITGSFTIGGTAATAPMAEGATLLLAAQPAAATITLPPNPVTNGAQIAVCNTTAAPFATNVVNLVANTGQTLSGGSVALTALASLTCVRLQFNRPNTTWYRVQ
jgi:hypothetical protein